MSNTGTVNRVVRAPKTSVYAPEPPRRGRPVVLLGLVALLAIVVVGAALLNQSATPTGVIVAPPGSTPAVESPSADSTVSSGAAAAGTATSEAPTAPSGPPPTLSVPDAVATPAAGSTGSLRGLADGINRVTVNGRPARVEFGAFTADVLPEDTSLEVVGFAPDGRTVSATVGLGSDRVEPGPQTIAVHVALEDMVDPARWLPIVALAEQGKINAVQIDIKDEAGEVGYLSNVELADTVGAVIPRYDPAATIKLFHDLNVKVIGRIVCFLDPKFGAWAWGAGRPELVVQQNDGTPLANEYGSAAFANVAQPDVQQYIWDLTDEAIGLGFDEVLYDYVRRPEGDQATMMFPGIETTPTVAVARFVRDSAEVVDSRARFGVSVFGIAATRPDEIGQDVQLLSPHVDYIAPMLYPALWGDGEYGVERPWKTPGQIIDRALVDFHRVTAGSGAAIVPWLQDFDAGRYKYGPEQVREQIDAAAWQATSGYLLWNPNSVYDI
jgi:hypothetical protein